MEGPWDKPNTDSEPGKARWMAKGNPEETPHKRDSNSCEGMTLSPSMCLSTCVVLFLLLINTLLISLLSVFGRILYLQSWRARTLSLTRGLVARIQSVTAMVQPQPLTGNWRPTSICVGRGHLRSIWFDWMVLLWSQIQYFFWFQVDLFVTLAFMLLNQCAV